MEQSTERSPIVEAQIFTDADQAAIATAAQNLRGVIKTFEVPPSDCDQPDVSDVQMIIDAGVVMPGDITSIRLCLNVYGAVVEVIAESVVHNSAVLRARCFRFIYLAVQAERTATYVPKAQDGPGARETDTHTLRPARGKQGRQKIARPPMPTKEQPVVEIRRRLTQSASTWASIPMTKAGVPDGLEGDFIAPCGRTVRLVNRHNPYMTGLTPSLKAALRDAAGEGVLVVRLNGLARTATFEIESATETAR